MGICRTLGHIRIKEKKKSSVLVNAFEPLWSTLRYNSESIYNLHLHRLEIMAKS